MKKYHDLTAVHFKDDELILTIDGKIKRFSLVHISRILEKASNSERSKFEISPSGYGIYWPDFDEDLSIDGLLGIEHKRQSKKQAA